MRSVRLLLGAAALVACADPHIQELPDGGSDDGVCAPAQEACDPLVTCSETRDQKALCGTCPAGYLGNGYDGCQPTLDALTLSAGKLDPAFAKDVTEYLWVTGMAAEATTFIPRAPAGITISVDGKKVRTGETTDSLGLLPYESRVRTLQLVAPNGLTQTVKVTTKRSWLWSQTVRASNRDAGDEFGRAVAVTDKYLVVGAPGEGSGEDPNQNQITTSGAIYVYDLETGSEALVKSLTPRVDDNFGATVAMFDESIAVGVPNDNSASTGVNGPSGDDGAPRSGSVWIVRNTNRMWSSSEYLKSSNSSPGDMFGSSLAMTGKWLVVGAPNESSASTDPTDESAPAAGAVYLFDLSQNEPREVAYIKAPHPTEYAEFGAAVAINDAWLAVGARSESSGAKGIDGDQTDGTSAGSGAVFLYRMNDGAPVFESYIKASNAEASDGFGWSVALDENTLFVGAPYEAGSSTSTPPDPTSNGAPGAGAVYVFQRRASEWKEVAYLKSPRPRSSDSFGRRLAACGDQRLLVGALGQSSSSSLDGALDDEAAEASGALFVVQPSPFLVRAALKVPTTRTGAELGSAVACAGGTVAGGARGDSGEPGETARSGAGAVFLYR